MMRAWFHTLRYSLPLAGGAIAMGAAVVVVAPEMRRADATTSAVAATPGEGTAVGAAELFVTGGYCTLPEHRDSTSQPGNMSPAPSPETGNSRRPADSSAVARAQADSVCTGGSSPGGSARNSDLP